MADTINLPVIAPTLPPGSCVDPAYVQLIGKTQVLFPAEYGLTIKSPNEPTVEQRDFVWFKTDSITGEITGRFTWSGLYGAWIQPHWPNGVPTGERRLLVPGTDVDTYDGGEAGTVTETRGPFWTTTGASTATDDLVNDFPDVGTDGYVWVQPTARLYDRSV
jgi:hypothetical protein